MLTEEPEIQDSSDVESIATDESSARNQHESHAAHAANGINPTSTDTFPTGKRITIGPLLQ